MSDPEAKSGPTSPLKMSRRKAAGGAMHFTDVKKSPLPSRPSRLVLSGERAERSRVAERLAYLSSVEQLRHQSGVVYSWETLLAGEVGQVSSGGVRPRSKLCTTLAGAKQARGVISFGGSIESGADYKRLAAEYPTQRYKFYHSFGNLGASEAYLTSVIKEANHQGLSLVMKSYDHAYDGINLYTYHFGELREIVTEMYKKYPEAFLETEHFLQGVVGDLNPRHIGWAQEPIAGLGHSSHSVRMGVIGNALDEHGLNESIYRSGCMQAGVLPDAPWLLSQQYEQQLAAKAASLHA